MSEEKGLEVGAPALEVSEKPQLPQGYSFVEEDVVEPTPEPAKPEVVKEETEETENSEQPNEERSEGDKPKRRGGFQKKIERLQAERDALLAQLAEKTPQNQETQPVANSEKPKLDDFETYEAYNEALVDWKTEQKLAERESKSREQAQKAEIQTRINAYEKSKDMAREKFQDFDDVVESYQGPTSPELNEAILSSDVGAELAYNLAKQPELVAKLNTMSPIQLGREIAKIEATIQNKVSSVAAKKVTSAPQPIKPVGAVKSSGSFDLNSDFTLEEFKAARAKGLI